MTVEIERLSGSDASEVVSLYERDADRWRAEKAWAWRLRGRDWAFGAVRGGRLVGFVAATPTRLVLSGRDYEAAQVGGGGLGVPTRDPEVDAALLARVLAQLEADGVPVAFAAPEEALIDVYRAVGFAWLFEVYARNLYVGLEKVSSRLSKAALDPVRRFAKEARRLRPKLVESELDPARLDELASLVALDGGPGELGVVKDLDYLRWRYVEDPRTTYRLFTYRSKAGQGVSAFALARRFEPEGGRPILHVDEHWTRRDSRRDLAKLVGELALVALSEHCDAVRCTAAGGSAVEQALVSMSCIRKKVDRHFLVRALDPTLTLPGPSATEDVRLTSGDLSLYLT